MLNASRMFYVLVVDDDPAMRLMVRAMLERDPHLHVVGEAHNGRDAVDLAARTCPHAVILGLQMPLMDGVTAAQLIKRVCPKTAVVIFSAVTAMTLIEKAYEAGADLYLSKTTPPTELAEALIAVCLLAEDRRLDNTA